MKSKVKIPKPEIQHLFIYGTLLNADNYFGSYLTKNSSPCGAGYFNGRLYDLGDYPAAVFDSGSHGLVHGRIIHLTNAVEAFKIIDEYEGIAPDQPETNEYVREIVVVNTGGQQLACWVYLYNLPELGLHRIESGNYLTK